MTDFEFAASSENALRMTRGFPVSPPSVIDFAFFATMSPKGE
jgi:hypothetical protein